MIDREEMIHDIIRNFAVSRTDAEKIADRQIAEMNDLVGRVPDDPEETARMLIDDSKEPKP